MFSAAVFGRHDWLAMQPICIVLYLSLLHASAHAQYHLYRGSELKKISARMPSPSVFTAAVGTLPMMAGWLIEQRDASMRTPTPMIVGIVFGPCGLVLNLTSTLAPGWRDISLFPDQSRDLIQHQGIWDICNEYQSTQTTQCNVGDTLGYFSQKPVEVAKGLMPSSVIVTVLGLVVASLGVRCWQDVPQYLLAGLGGLLLFVSGLLSLIAVSWYNHELLHLPYPDGSILKVGYCLVLGYLGSCLEILGGISLALSFIECCRECKLKKAARDNNTYPPGWQQRRSNIAAISSSLNSKELYIPDRTPTPWAYNNYLDVLQDERSSNRSKLPCDSDL